MAESPLASLPSTLLFQFAVPCLHVEPDEWRRDGLSAGHRIPCFGALEEGRPFAEVRMGWNAQELVFQVDLRGDEQAFLPQQGEDVIQLLIDTRATHNVHRASRFCHWFVMYPFGTQNQKLVPQVMFPPIRQARELPKPPPRESVLAEVRGRSPQGYSFMGAILAEGLTGYDPAEHPKLGFQYLISNARLGLQSFTASTEIPIQSDPSLWGDLELRS